MRAVIHALAALGFVVCLAGCTHHSAAPAKWVEQLGGSESGLRDERLQRVCSGLLPEHLQSRVRAAVLCSAEPAAYSWPSGEVFVTCGLIDLLGDDDHLAAAVAHEVGHLLADERHGGRGAVASLRGRETRDDGLQAECDADATGAELLRRAGLQPSQMTAMLRKVRDAAHLPPQYRDAMARRIEQLERTTTPRS
jgi:predicted Zn-dependent protease